MRLGNFEYEVQQGSVEWHRLRHGKITPSRFKTVVAGSHEALTDYLAELRSPFDAAAVRVEPIKHACEWGRYHEAEALANYLLATGVRPRACGFFRHPDLPRVGGSPDAVILNGTQIVGGVEIKCPFNSLVHERTWHAGIPSDHLYQVHGYMWLLGASYWDFVSYDPRHANPERRLYYERVARDERWIARITSRVLWLHEILGSGREIPAAPPIEACLRGDISLLKLF